MLCISLVVNGNGVPAWKKSCGLRTCMMQSLLARYCCCYVPPQCTQIYYNTHPVSACSAGLGSSGLSGYGKGYPKPSPRIHLPLCKKIRTEQRASETPRASAIPLRVGASAVRANREVATTAAPGGPACQSPRHCGAAPQLAGGARRPISPVLLCWSFLRHWCRRPGTLPAKVTTAEGRIQQRHRH